MQCDVQMGEKQKDLKPMHSKCREMYLEGASTASCITYESSVLDQKDEDEDEESLGGMVSQGKGKKQRGRYGGF